MLFFCLLLLTAFETVARTDFWGWFCRQCGAFYFIFIARGHVRVDCFHVTLIYKVVKTLFSPLLRLISFFNRTWQ